MTITKPERRALQILERVSTSMDPAFFFDVREATSSALTKKFISRHLSENTRYQNLQMTTYFVHKSSQTKARIIFKRWRIGYRKKFEHRANTWLKYICAIYIVELQEQFLSEYKRDQRTIRERSTPSASALAKAEAALYEKSPWIAKIYY